MTFHPLRELRNIHWELVIAVMLLGLVGVSVLYSVAGSSFSPWGGQHALRLAIGIFIMLALALIDIRLLYNSIYIVFIGLIVLLLVVEFAGTPTMGAQRWLDLGIIRLQPSEFMRLGLVLALARFYQSRHRTDVSKLHNLFIPALMVAAPALLVFVQPDLGTTLMLIFTALGIMFLAGVAWRYFILGAASIAIAIPFAWQQLLPYQKQRILVFLNPESDPLGAGYHIIQSKISIGSGGVFGKGFGEGTQSRLNFLPENHTDFIFSNFAEEMGFLGGVFLLLLFAFVIFVHFVIATRMRNSFSRLCVSGLGWAFFVYIGVNLAMVMGLLPVVGVPLPFISFGGTSLLTFLAGIGVVLCVERQMLTELPRPEK